MHYSEELDGDELTMEYEIAAAKGWILNMSHAAKIEDHMVIR